MKYLYRCNICLHEFEKEQKLKHVLNHAKHSKVKCPKCKGSTRKVINATPVFFKGGGWGGDKK